jgi:protocatechuate 3,4-dioxygenase beta subunit
MKRWVALALVILAAIVGLWWRARPGPAQAAAGSTSAPVRTATTMAGRPTVPPDVRLAARGSIAGQVRAGDGTAIAGAMVCATFWASDLTTLELKAPRCSVSAADGGYVLAELWPATYLVSASAARFRPGRPVDPQHSGKHDLELGAGEARVGVDIVLAPGGREDIGRVLDVGGGPIDGAQVIADTGAGEHDLPAAMTRSGADGSFTVWLAPGEISLQAHALGYAAAMTTGPVPGHVFELHLTPESVLVGRVEDAASHAPIAEATVEARCDADWETTRSDAGGRFTIGGLDPGRCVVSAEAPGLRGIASPSIELGFGQTSTDIVVAMHPAAMVEGQVSLAGKPCAGGQVSLEGAEGDRQVSASADAAGRVVFSSVLPGHYTVLAQCEGAQASDAFPLLEVGTADVVGQRWPLEPGVAIHGRVVDQDGQPVADARIRLDRRPPLGPRRWFATQSGPDGQFEVDDVIPGTYRVETSVLAPDASPEAQDLEVGAGRLPGQALEIVVRRGAAVHGTVLDQDGKPVAGAEVLASGHGRDDDWTKGNATTRDDGSYQIGGLRPGTYQVCLASRIKDSREITIAGGDDLRLDFRTPAARAQLRGRVVDAKGRPVSDAFIVAAAEDPDQHRGSLRSELRWVADDKPVITDLEGRFVLDGVPALPHTVRAWRKGGGEAIVEGATPGKDLLLIIPALASIDGTVSGLDAVTADQMTVTLRQDEADLDRQELFFHGGGVFAVDDLPAGSISVEVRTPLGHQQLKVDLAAGEHTTVHLTLERPSRLRGQVMDLDSGQPLSGARVMSGRSASVDADRNGRFVLDDCAPGPVAVWVYLSNSYPSVTLKTSCLRAQDVELPPVRLPRLHHDRDAPAGSFQFTTEPGGTRVISVFSDGPAAHAGLAIGDVIVTVEGHDVTGANTYLLAALRETVVAGESLSFGITRGSEHRDLRITAVP